MNVRNLIAIGLLSLLFLFPAACGQGAADAPAAVEQPEAASVAGGADALSGLPQNTDGYVDIGVEQLAAAMPGEDLTLVNVHIPYEGELPNTDLFIPFDEILAHQDELPAKDAPIVLYCRSGNMSTTAARELVEAGYTNVYELDGGFIDWQASGYELLMQQ